MERQGGFTGLVLLVTISLLFSITYAATDDNPPTDVSPPELLAMLKSGNVKLFDVRNPYELKLEGRIAGSVNIPLNQVEGAFSLSNQEFQAKYKVSLPSKDDCNVVFHCKSGGRSYKALQIARKLGFFCVRHLVGGFDAWKKLYGARK